MGDGKTKSGPFTAMDYKGDGVAYVLIVNSSYQPIDTSDKLSSALGMGGTYFMVGHFKPDSGDVQFLSSLSKNHNPTTDVVGYAYKCAIWPNSTGAFYFNLSSSTLDDIVVTILNI